MRIKVHHKDGRIEELTLKDGPWEVRGHMLTDGGVDHFFNDDGSYGGWGGFVPQGTTFEQGVEIAKAMEEKRVIQAPEED